MLIWKANYLKEIEEMNNDSLFNEYSELLTDVDNDGIRSNRSEWKLDRVYVELKDRLIKSGFLTN